MSSPAIAILPHNAAARLHAYLDAFDGSSVCRSVELRRRIGPFGDARLFFRDKQWLGGSQGRAFLAELEADPFIDAVVARGPALTIRFHDDYVAALAARLVAGDDDLRAVQPLSGQTIVSGFGGPNTSKALHVGHLRNLTLGHALGAAHAAAGARVVSQSLLGDFGRSVCEAMAGFLARYKDDDPVSSGLKPDHFVDRCYAAYLADSASEGAASNDPIAREMTARDDPAEDLMRRWMAGEPFVRHVWNRVRGWVLEGHERTCERLGMRHDRFDCEAEQVPALPALMERGIQAGVLTRTDDGAVVYHSGREDFETMVLIRPDGFPTEHARLLAVYGNMLENRGPDETYLDLAGQEWQPASAVHMDLLPKLWPGLNHDSHVQLFHGMVTFQGSKLSSTGGALLLDTLIDRVEAEPAVRALDMPAEAAAAFLLKSFFLFQPARKNAVYSRERFLDEKTNPGWLSARTWCAVANSGNDGDIIMDETLRFAVLNAQEWPFILAHAVRTRDLSGPCSFLLHYSRNQQALLDRPEGRILLRTVLKTAMRSLGLLPEGGFS
ncbi:MAG: arginine--tRNA ligase [Acidobacteriota bacterium]|nr:arginine--tRNA ligase [Acidobacteriota bacterium]